MNIESTLAKVAHSYPPEMVAAQVRDIPRIAFNIRTALGGRDPSGVSVCDLGGGVGLFSPGCAALGMKSVLVDDFADPVNDRFGDVAFAAHRRYGVEVVSRDVLKTGVSDLGGFDIVTTFDSMEHWHDSPKALFAQVSKSLMKPGARFVLGVPNCVNLRKRLTVPFGVGKWSQMADWYEQPTFRGHVREPDVADLRYIAHDMGLKNGTVLGRNWLGYFSRFGLIRALTPIADIPLSFFPSLCSDIYLTGNT